MRLARLVAAGLAVGVVIGFAIALLRPRPSDPIAGQLPPPNRVTDAAAGQHAYGAAGVRNRYPGPEDDVLDIRTEGPVTG
jgi:hypothetical protein